MDSYYQSLKIIKENIARSGRKQKWIANKLRMHESQLSEILNGKRNPRNKKNLILRINNLINPLSNN